MYQVPRGTVGTCTRTGLEGTTSFGRGNFRVEIDV